jgi:hypothetical protein
LYLGIELITLVPLVLTAPTYVELFLSIGMDVLSASFGKDEYINPVILYPESRVAATGRKCLFLNNQRPAHLYQAGPTELIHISHYQHECKSFHLFLVSSLSLTTDQLIQGFCLKVTTHKGSRMVRITNYNTEHYGNGKFVVHLGRLSETHDRKQLAQKESG